MAFDKKKFLSRFAHEARNHLSHLREGSLILERHPEKEDVINTIFRSAHTIKGSASMLSLDPISEFAHVVEQTLSTIRDGQQQMHKNLADTLLQASDQLEQMIQEAEAEKPISHPSQVLLDVLAGQQSELEVKKEPTIAHPPSRTANFSLSQQKLDELMKQINELTVWGMDSETQIQEMSQLKERVKTLENQFAERNMFIPIGMKQLFDAIDTLSVKMNRSSYELKRISSELQDNLIDLRMVPISMITEQLPRFIRDTAAAMNKEVQLTLIGVDTELDRTILDKVEQALLHIIRNAVDHGIESKQMRVENHKNPVGTITFEAGYVNGMCRITISDDGAGVPVHALIEKAKALKLITDQKEHEFGRNLNSNQLIELLSLPSLSSASLITETSGRGVGMDVVRQCIVDDLSGQISIETKAGVGTSITLLLPLNQAIMDVFMFRIGSIPIALPTSAVQRIIKTSQLPIIDVAANSAIRLDEQILLAYRLHELFEETDADKEESSFFLIVKHNTIQTALLVDEVLGQRRAIIQSLPSYLQNNPYISGCITTGSNKIVHLLNPHGLARLSVEQQRAAKDTVILHEKQLSILVVDDSLSTRDIEKSILESHGYRVELASDGIEALETVREEQFDLVITDIEMPNMDGMELTKALRSEKPYRHTPIILVTSRDKLEDKKRGIEAGADAYIVKSSFDQDNLISTIQLLTGEKHANL